MLSEGYKETEVGVIPIEWEVVKLENIVKKLQSGGTPLSTNSDFYDGDIPFVKIDDITRSKKYLLNTKVAITQNGLDSSSAWLVPINSILYSMYASIGFLSINKVEVATNQAIMNIIPDNSKITLEFLYQYLLDLKGKIDKFIDQTTQKNLNAQKIRNFKIPLPPLKEQEKIADILSTADEKIDAIEEQIQKAETLKKGLLQKLLSDGIGHSKFKDSELGKIPESWYVVKLETICDVRDGTHDSPKYQKDGIPFITSKHLTDNGIDFNDVNYISNEDHINFSKRSLVENGDILFGMIGTIGKPLIVNYDFEFSIKNVALLKFKDNTKLNNSFTLNLLKSTIIDKQFSKLSNGGVQSFIALGMIRSLKIPLPPLKEQKQIADILSTADERLEVLRAKKQMYETLKKGLLQKLLSGEVRV